MKALILSKIKIVFFSIFFLMVFGVYAQVPGWNCFNAPTVIYAAKFENNFIWVVSTGGVTKFDTISKSCTYYNQFNSGLSSPNVFSIAIDASNNKWFGTGGGPTGTTESVFPGNGLVKFNGATWVVYNTANSGLPHNTVRAVFVDSAGIIWAGTYAGLAKFDGISWTVFNRSNSGIPSDSITCITVDNFGKKWIGTYHGVASFDDITWVAYKHSTSGLPGDTIRTIAVDNNNVKWIGTSRAGLGKFDGTTWQTFNTSNSGLPYKNVTAILPESNGNLWIGTYGIGTVYGGGVSKFDGISSWTTYNAANSGLPKDNVPAIISDTVGNKWVFSERGQKHGDGIGKVSIFDEVSWKNYSITNCSPLSNFTYHITRDNSNNLWYGGEKAGLSKFDGTTWSNYNTDSSGITDDDILDIKFDAAGDLWAIHDFGRMSKFDGTNFTSFTSPGGISDDPRCLYIDSLGAKWIGENGTGINIWDGVSWSNIVSATSGLPNDRVYSIVVDNTGTKWIGTYGGGVAKYDGTTWFVYNTTNSSLLTNNVNYVEVDQFQNIWVASQNGLAMFDGTTWILYRTVNSGLPSNIVNCVAFDMYGVLWAATSNGVAKFDGTVWTTYNFTIPANFAFKHINFDASGNVWVGTVGRGIIKITNTPLTTSISPELSDSNPLLIYPNPFSDETTIALNFEVHQADFSFKVYDVMGREVNCFYSIQSASEKTFVKVSSSDLTSGVYFFALSANNKVQSGRMVIQK